MKTYNEIMEEAEEELAVELKRTRLKQKKIKNVALRRVRELLHRNLMKCTDGEKLIFKKMYAGGDLNKSLSEIITDMDQGKLGWASGQVERTLAKRGVPF